MKFTCAHDISDRSNSDGTLSDASGQLFIKPATPAEAAFYQTSINEHPNFAEFMPTFLGTLQLTATSADNIEEQAAVLIAQHATPSAPKSPLSQKQQPRHGKIVTDQAIVLMNAAYGFKQPNILDVKLGIRLWADDAREEKKMRFNKITEETTHKKLGFRIAGMRVWQGDKAMQNGVIDKDGYRIYDKEFGKVDVNDDNVHDAFRKFFFTESAGIDEELGKLVVQAFLADLADIQEVLESEESRMYSASLLFVFEGDGAALRFAMEEASKSVEPSRNGELDDDDEYHDDEDDDDEEDTSPKIYSLKVIDFANAEWLPGMGPDENSLQGVRSVASILNDLVKS